MELKEIEKTIIERTITKITSLASKIRAACFESCFSLTSVSFPNATSISGAAFNECTALTDISFPNVTSIGVNAFNECTALTDISFPNATSIGVSVFNNCSALTTADFPNVTSIGEYAFQYCSALTTADFPNATSIGEYAFSNCDNLNLHLYQGIVSIGKIGEEVLSTAYNPPKAVYFHYNEADEVLFSPADAIGKGSSKGTLTYNIYTDNTIIKDGVLSKADQYTIVNVKHLDGSDWA